MSESEDAKPREIPKVNKWVWAMGDFSERLVVAKRRLTASAAEGIPPEFAIPGALHEMIAGPPKMPYPVAQEVVEDLQNALTGVYFHAHNFGRFRRGRPEDA